MRLLPFGRQPYNKLEQVLRSAGDSDKANYVHLKWRQAERKNHFRKGNYANWLLGWIYQLVANYGIRPYRLIVMSLLITVIGSLYFHQPGTMKLKGDSPGGANSYVATWNDAVGMSLRQFLPISIPAAEEIVPQSTPVNVRIKWRKRHIIVSVVPALVATLIKLFGWILVPLGIGSLAGILRRRPLD